MANPKLSSVVLGVIPRLRPELFRHFPSQLGDNGRKWSSVNTGSLPRCLASLVPE